MSRQPSDATQLRDARRRVKELTQELVSARQALNGYRARATSAEQACAEWKVRFDKLLEFRQLLKVE